MEIDINLGKRIKEIRMKKKVSLTDLSQNTGIQLATLSRIENDKMVGTLETHIRIASVLEVSLSDLYKDIKIDGKSINLFSPGFYTGIY